MQDAAQLWEGLCKNATEGMAKRDALPVWTVILGGGQVLPALLMLIGAERRGGAGAGAPGSGCGWCWPRASGSRVLSALLHPVGVAALLGCSGGRCCAPRVGGKATWRGRAYTAQ